jgi:hypothetical protein
LDEIVDNVMVLLDNGMFRKKSEQLIHKKNWLFHKVSFSF